MSRDEFAFFVIDDLRKMLISFYKRLSHGDLNNYFFDCCNRLLNLGLILRI